MLSQGYVCILGLLKKSPQKRKLRLKKLCSNLFGPNSKIANFLATEMQYKRISDQICSKMKGEKFDCISF